MKYLITFLLVSLLTISVQAQCLINFNPNQSGDSLNIVGQGIDTTIGQSATLNLNGQGAIVFTYNGSDGSIFSYDCNGITYHSGSMIDGQQHFESNQLPVELTFFNGKTVDNVVLLTWQTSSEENNAGFEVEHSTDGINFENIGFVQGHGTAILTQNYNYIDNIPKKGWNYYRLKQIDFDGAFEYSDMVSIKFDSDTETIKSNIIGNVVDNQLTISGISGISGEGQAFIISNFGQVIKTIQLTESNIVTVDVSTLQKGIYYVHFENNTLRFIKI